MSNTPRPVLIMNSVMAGLGIILSGAALADYIDLKLVGLLLLIHSGVSVGWAVYTQSQVTPNEKVAASKEIIDGVPMFVAGDAQKAIATGCKVDVTLTDDPGWLPPEQGGAVPPG